MYQGCNQVYQSKIAYKERIPTIEKYNLPKSFLLYVGSIEERKNLITLLQTLIELPNQKLVIIGNGKSYKKRCLEFIDTNNLSNRVILLSRISLKDMAVIYQCAEIMIYPSIFEGFGIPILESLFSKTPVISSKGGCFSEAGGLDSKYIDPLSVKDIKSAIIEIQKSTDLKKNMQKRGFKYAQNFTDDKIAKNLMSVYRNL